MADNDDDDEFGSDLDNALFDDLPPNTLIQLEQQGTQFFQQRNQDSRPATSHRAAAAPEYATNAAQSAWQAKGKEQESWQSERTVQRTIEHGAEQQEYMFDDEDIVDLDEDPYALPQQFDQGRTLVGRLETGPSQAYDHVGKATQAEAGAAVNDASVAELQARILALESDRSFLQKQVEEARSAAQSKAGEAAILRGKAEKAAKDYEQKVAQLRLQHAEERAKQKSELDRVTNEREKLSTNNRFLEHDLAFETGKVRQLQRTQRPVDTAALDRARPIPTQQHVSPAVTPRKTNKVLPYRDGFDDSDLVMLSPSKPRDRSKPTTPSKTAALGAGAKRKRTTGPDTSAAPAAPSPPPRLALSEPKIQAAAPQPVVEVRYAADLLHKLSLSQNKLRFMQQILQHHVNEDDGENIFEVLTVFAFPSAPERKLSSILYESLSLSASAFVTGKSISDHFTDTIFSLWSQALQENYYPPLPYFVSITQRIFELERFSFIRRYTVRASQLAIATADLVAVPFAREAAERSRTSASRSLGSARTSTNGSFAFRPPPAAPSATQPGLTDAEKEQERLEAEAKKHVAVLPCLELLQTIANAARPNQEAITLFWQTMKFDFVLMFLMNGVPVEQMGVMLEMLGTSCLKETFGTISESAGVDGARQERREVDTLDRLTALLSEKLKPAHDARMRKPDDGTESDVGVSENNEVDMATVFEIRLKIVEILHTLVFTPRGASLLAHHRHAIGRLFQHLHTSLSKLPLFLHPSSHTPLTQSINATMPILYLLCSSTGSSQLNLPIQVDVRQKLSGVQGGMHLHLLALTRVAFAERIWLERGIGVGVGEMAHEMLDEWLSPEEGEGLMGMFGSDSTESGGVGGGGNG